MLKQRLLVIFFLVPVCVLLAVSGGWILYIPVALALGVIGWEYWTMFYQGGYQASRIILIAGIPVMFLSQAGFGFTGRNLALTLLILFTILWYIITYERGEDQAIINLSITLTGLLCIGWLSTYLIPLRDGPDGMWWTLLTMVAVAIGDSGGYIIGHLCGRHKLSRRVSPHKTWEGYIGGIVFATIATSFAASIGHSQAPMITPIKGALLGLILSALTPLGDFTVSLFKRTFGLKDTSHLIPGHGGFWDRFDTFLWAVFIGYFLINSLWFQQSFF